MVSKMKYKPFIFWILCIMILVIYSCSIYVYKYEDMTYYKKPFAPNQIRTDGYFTNRLEGEDSLFMEILCFYKDGFCLFSGVYPIDGAALMQQEFRKTKGISKRRSAWGVYCIENDTITVQSFLLDTSPNAPNAFYMNYSVIQSKGVVVNSEKFTLFEDVYRGKTEKVNLTYQFHPCVDCKPDSTNWLRTNKKLNKLYPKIE